ncbi:MAG: preprotein translocase subunit SecA [Proteobacteria bacterium SG_bin7]|nr:MAG: preprotein translocase subunit SecA [Proteobacteria bacterium SG_bin7]
MLRSLAAKIFGTKHDRDMKKVRPVVAQINALESEIKKLTDEQLREKTNEFKQRLAKGETLDDILPEAFAVCREASSRVLKMRHYDVQLIGGIILHRGNISEMKTGEGKTLVATLPVYLNALAGKGVHVVTVNDYLAKRDSEWMGRLYKFLGLTVGIIVHELNDKERQVSYNSDITYGTNNEFGFDYLRDNMKFDIADYVQRPLNYAIVDECDSILIDEARTPLIISGPAEGSTEKYLIVNKVIPHLKKDIHFVMEEKSKTASLSEEGNAKVEELLGIENLYDPGHIDLLHHVYQGLKAYHLYKRDVDYMVRDNEVIIVDEFTGRLMPGRRWSDGLHQAIEAKESVAVKNENQTLATITFQNYFRMYKKLSGMTGTADTEAVEFKKIYSLDVVVIPTNKPINRNDNEDLVYKTEKAKFKAIIDDIRERTEKGQPCLVGTASIEKSELLSQFLKNAGVRHNVLNAKHHEREADIIAQAGRKSSVTIATNMAGRGTDILLGGNAEVLAKHEWKGDNQSEFEALVQKYKTTTENEKKEVIAAGGLYIVGTERHESRRIDNQLRGRAGRQGDPGESRFYLSLDDSLMRIFNGERLQKIMNTLKVPDDEPITARMVTGSIEGAQRKVEAHNFDIRKHLLEYDDVMNQQRTLVYGLRRRILENQNVGEVILEMLSDVTSSLLDTFVPADAKAKKWDLAGLSLGVQQQFGVGVEFSESQKLNANDIVDTMKTQVKAAFEEQKNRLGPFYDHLQKMILLQTIDTRWKEHLARIDKLKEGINLRAYAQKDPLIEYKKEAYRAFEEMNQLVRAETIEKLFKVQVMSPDQARDLELDSGVDSSKLSYNNPAELIEAPTLEAGPAPRPVGNPMRFGPMSGPPPQPRREIVTARRDEPKVGRNDPCPCGSGKKYKKCHGSMS